MSQHAGARHAEPWTDGEAFTFTIALGVIGAGLLILFYVATPLRLWLRAQAEPVALHVEALDTPDATRAAGSYVAFGPVDLDYHEAGVRFIDAPNYADAAYAAYVPVRDSAGRVRLVVRQTGYRDLRDVPRTRVHVERVTGVLVRGAPGLLARVDDWPGRPLAGYRLRDLWILLAGERPPRPPDFTRAGILGLVLVLVPVVGGAAYLRRRALRRH